MKRRTVLTGMAGAASALALGQAHGSDTASAAPAAASGCSLITQDITGPYFLDARQVRSDIAEGQPGVPLQFDFQVVDTFHCRPLPGAVVHLWQNNALGLYSGVHNVELDANLKPLSSGVDLTDSSFLRGIQTADAEGRVRFRTIVPGWYAPRPTHVHLKVFPPSFGEVATTQLYFPLAFCDEIYQHEAYAARGPNPFRDDHTTPSPNAASNDESRWITPQRVGQGYQHSMQLGVTFYGKAFGELTEFYEQG
jgi:protocatechuate 3,4-dioxygenase beta subunit